MTIVRTVAAHEVVRAAFPRPVSESDQLGMAVGKAIDETLAHFSHEVREARRSTLGAMTRWAGERLDRELEESALALEPDRRNRELEAITGVIQAFRTTEIMGLARPRSRMILIDEAVGVYAQPDYWDGRDRFFEMKSYRAVPPPPDVELQMRVFQLAFPGFRSFLACFDRHAVPVTTTISLVPPISPDVSREVLTRARATALELGVPKVLEYIDAPTVRYTLDAGVPG
jgi:hypothetical protein